MSEFSKAVDLAISALEHIQDTSDRPPRASRRAVDRLREGRIPFPGG